MKTIIGIRREDKNIWERRVPITPIHAKEIIQNNPIEILVQPSKIRIFTDSDYMREGIRVEEDLSPCSIIFAIKEIPLTFFKEGKAYFFFSHTIKGQPHNMPMLRKMVDLKCTLVDYEKIVNEKGQRVLFFGKQAGQAGMIDTLWAYAQRLLWEKQDNPFSKIKQTFQYRSLAEAEEVIKEVGNEIRTQGLPPSLTPFVCGFSGYGNVSQGAQEVFNLLPVEEILPSDLISLSRRKEYSSNKVYKVVFKEEHMVKTRSKEECFELQDYYKNPHKYEPIFEMYLPYLNILVNCIYWDERYPRFVTKRFLKSMWERNHSPRLKVIGDLSCDINGSIECTLKATEPDHPVFVYDPIKDEIKDGVEGRGIVIMAVDNLPAELPLESSVFFSTALKPLIPKIARANFSGSFSDLNLPEEIKRAVILFRGEFTPDYRYMENYIKNL